jgi:hypothetical protein
VTPQERMKARRLRLQAGRWCIGCAKRKRGHTRYCSYCAERVAESYQRRRVSTGKRGDGSLMPVPEIARELGVTQSAVRQTLYSALRKLRKAYRVAGFGIADVVGRPLSMLASAEERE